MPHTYDHDAPPLGTCADCGDLFWLALGERAFFERNRLPLPKRCAACREAKRAANARRGERPRVDFADGRAHDRRDAGRVISTSRRP